MAYITGKFEYPGAEIVVEVLQPTKDENDFENGMNIQVGWDDMSEWKPDELRHALKWLSDTVDAIEKGFNKDGSKKQ
jgi:hypothetical protein